MGGFWLLNRSLFLIEPYQLLVRDVLIALVCPVQLSTVWRLQIRLVSI